MTTLVLTDFDGTFFGRYNQPTIAKEKLQRAIKQAKEANLVVGLNTDGTEHRLHHFVNEYAFNGPIVTERANAISLPNLTIFQNFDNKRLCNTTKHLVFNFLRETYPVSVCENMDDLEITKQKNENRTIYLIGGSSFSISFFYTIKVSSFFKSFLKALQKFLLENHIPMIVEHFEQISYVQIMPMHSKKGDAIPIIQKKLQPKQIFMIGDNDPDFLGHHEVRQIGVANSSDFYKKRCEFVTRSDSSQGFVEALEYIRSQI